MPLRAPDPTVLHRSRPIEVVTEQLPTVVTGTAAEVPPIAAERMLVAA